MKVTAHNKFDPTLPDHESLTKAKYHITLESSEEIAHILSAITTLITRGNPLKSIVLNEIIMSTPIDILQKEFVDKFKEKDPSTHFMAQLLLDIRKAREVLAREERINRNQATPEDLNQ